jgi:hypothetical protein
MHGAVMISWGANVPGREATGIEVFGGALQRFETMTKQGRLEGHREYFSITGRDGGFMLLEGEVEELTKILSEEETLKLNSRASAVVEDFSIQAFVGGTDNTTQELIGTYTSSLKDIGFM